VRNDVQALDQDSARLLESDRSFTALDDDVLLGRDDDVLAIWQTVGTDPPQDAALLLQTGWRCQEHCVADMQDKLVITCTLQEIAEYTPRCTFAGLHEEFAVFQNLENSRSLQT
jgi:hypothetical protein